MKRILSALCILISLNSIAQQTNNSGFTIIAQQSVDGKQYKTLSGRHVPYANTVEYLAYVPTTRRHIGQISYIYNGTTIEVWQFKGGINDTNLVKILPVTFNSTGSFVDSVTAPRDSLFYYKNNIRTFVTSIPNAVAGGDTTIFNVVLDSTGQANNKVLYSKNKKIASDNRFLYDDINKKVVINSPNISIDGTATKLYVGGNTTTEKLKILSPLTAPGSKSLRYNPTTKEVTVADTTVGGGGTTYTGTAPIVVTGSVISADTSKAQGKIATFNDIVINKPNLIAGTNTTITGTYPNLTFNSTGGGGGGTVALTKFKSFSNVIKFDTLIVLMADTCNKAINFNLDTTGKVAGYSTVVRLIADGVNRPTFDLKFKQLSGSDTFAITPNVINQITFFYNGVDFQYYITGVGDVYINPVAQFTLAKTGTVTITTTVTSGTLAWNSGDNSYQVTNVFNKTYPDNSIKTVTAFLNTAAVSAITYINGASQNLLTANLSGLTSMGGMLDFSLNPNLTSVIFPVSNAAFSFLRLYNCNLTGTLDVSGMTNPTGEFLFQSNPLLKRVIFPASSNTVTSVNVAACNLDSVDFRPLTGIQTYQFQNNVNLKKARFPITSSIIDIIYGFGTKVDTLNFSGLSNLGGNVYVNSNSLLKKVIFPTSNRAFVALDINTSNLTGSLDISGLTGGIGLFQFHTNPLLTSITLPTTSASLADFRGYSTGVTSLNMTGLTGATTYLNMSSCNALSSMSGFGWLRPNTNTIHFGGCALNLTSVNGILAAMDSYYSANAPTSNMDLILNTGTNASPTGGASNSNLTHLVSVYTAAGRTLNYLIN